MGSQKFGAYWTGDNLAKEYEILDCVQMILSTGISGFSFGGADVPGFHGKPSDELFIKFY
jgi:mannosyl-oligosaccharide alpha-1,3-glucosidase